MEKQCINCDYARRAANSAYVTCGRAYQLHGNDSYKTAEELGLLGTEGDASVVLGWMYPRQRPGEQDNSKESNALNGASVNLIILLEPSFSCKHWEDLK